ncbi:MAG: histidine kinase [Firmicutes bacterium]|nr:histidine kinase [Bacillota bacterium]
MSQVRNFDIREVIDLNLLQAIQEKFAAVTGLAFVTVDHKNLCYMSDAHAGLEAARRGQPCVYRCPAGLIDFAVPIIVHGQYLGAVLSGQVRCQENNDCIKESEVFKFDAKWQMNQEWTERYQKTLCMPYDKIISSANLVHLVINQLAEKEIINIIQEELTKNTVTLMAEKKARAELAEKLKIAELKSLKAQMSPHFLFNVLNSIGCSALTEGAQRTQEMIYMLSQLLRYNITNSDKSVTLCDDIQNIERYLKIQQFRFGDKISYSLNIQEDLKNQALPPLIIQPFIENAIQHGIIPKEGNGHLSLQAYSEGDDIKIKIEDNGIGMSPQKVKNLLSRHTTETEMVNIGIQNTRTRLIQSFGTQYDICIKSLLNIGTSIIIKIPLDFNERTYDDVQSFVN